MWSRDEYLKRRAGIIDPPTQTQAATFDVI